MATNARDYYEVLGIPILKIENSTTSMVRTGAQLNPEQARRRQDVNEHNAQHAPAPLDQEPAADSMAETVGARRSVVMRLAERGLIETVSSGADEPRLPRRVVIQLRRMQRLRRDLGVTRAPP